MRPDGTDLGGVGAAETDCVRVGRGSPTTPLYRNFRMLESDVAIFRQGPIGRKLRIQFDDILAFVHFPRSATDLCQRGLRKTQTADRNQWQHQPKVPKHYLEQRVGIARLMSHGYFLTD